MQLEGPLAEHVFIRDSSFEDHVASLFVSVATSTKPLLAALDDLYTVCVVAYLVMGVMGEPKQG